MLHEIWLVICNCRGSSRLQSLLAGCLISPSLPIDRLINQTGIVVKSYVHVNATLLSLTSGDLI